MLGKLLEISESKISRRDFVKVTGAGVLFLAMPNLAISSTDEKFEAPKSEDGEPLVILSKNKELRGFRGFDEKILRDEQLAERFASEDSIVILARDNNVIEFKGLEEYVLGDKYLSRSLSSKFNAGG